MPKRTVIISSRAHISISQGLLKLSTEEKAFTLPLDDLWALVVESTMSTATSAALSTLSEAGVPVIVCDKRHMPTGLLLPIVGHVRQSGIMRCQVELAEETKDALWQRIVRQKILNQAVALQSVGCDSVHLQSLALEVLPGDPTNVEGIAAASYFRSLLPVGSRRNGPYSVPLDYGYAILRASIARQVVAAGLHPAFGVHHSGQLNPFNLTDDLIEPFRPLVDLIVIANDVREPLDGEERRLLTSVLEFGVRCDGSKTSCQHAIERAVVSVRDVVMQNEGVDKLLLPELLPLERAEFE